MTKTQMVEVLVAMKNPISEATLNAMAKGDVDKVFKHFQGGGTVSEEPAEKEVLRDYRPSYLEAVRKSLAGSSGLQIAPKLKDDRYVVMLLDTKHRKITKSGKPAEKQICSTTVFQGLSFSAFKKGNVAPGRKDPESDWNLIPVLALEGGKELQIQIEATVCNHNTQWDTTVS